MTRSSTRAMAARAAILAACLGLPAPSEAAPEGLPGQFASPKQFGEPDGAAIWRGVCAGCHMPDGQGAQGAGAYPSLAGDERLREAAYPIEMLLHGRRNMPAFARTLTDAQIASVVKYIRTHFSNDFAGSPSAADVQAQR